MRRRLQPQRRIRPARLDPPRPPACGWSRCERSRARIRDRCLPARSAASIHSRVPDPALRFTKRTPGRARSSMRRIDFGLPGATIKSLRPVRQRDELHLTVREEVPHIRPVVFAALVQQMDAGDVAQTLPQVRQPVQRAQRTASGTSACRSSSPPRPAAPDRDCPRTPRPAGAVLGRIICSRISAPDTAR